MIVKSGGNVGIGTTSPQELLHVSASNTTATLEIQGGLNSITAVDQVHSEINFGANDASVTGGIAGSIKSISELSNGAHAGLAFYTGQQSRDPYLQRAMQIRNTGAISFGSGNSSYGASGQILKSNGINNPPSWVNASTVIGSFLPLAGGTMTGTTNHGDNVKARFGTGNDLEIYHDGNHSRIKDVGTGHLIINSTDFVVNNSADTKNMIIATDGGAVNLYNNGTKRLETKSDGVDIIGALSTTLNLLVSEGIGSTSAHIQIGQSRTASGFAYIDFVGDTTYSDYGFRIIRGNGALILILILYIEDRHFWVKNTRICRYAL